MISKEGMFMDQEKIGKFIKEIRINNNLTQNKFAEMLGVSFQAVSKWERGICIPDVSILREISRLFSVNINDILDGNTDNIVCDKKDNKNSKILYYIVTFCVLLLVLIICIFLFGKDKHDFEFKQISTSCDNFNITGSMAYNKDKTSLYISSVEFCGSDDNEVYEKISCTLFEEHENFENEISSCDVSYDITLEEYLKDVKIGVDNYELSCDTMMESELYLSINATLSDNKDIVYKIPITLVENSCNN